jgi:hypothetical protein
LVGNFQSTINRLADSEFLKFTAEVWGKDKKDGSNSKLVTVNESDHFPYLDMEMFWENQDLRFKVHLKENQMLKYLNKGSTHTKACFKAIPNGVLGRLAKLTSATEISKEKKLDELYPDHAEALRKADLAPKTFPTLKETLNKISEQNDPVNVETKKQKKRDKKRQTYFCIGVSNFWKVKGLPIHQILKKLRNKHELKWLRISMSYHKFQNLQELFQSDLSCKLMRGVGSKDFDDLKCNCNTRTKINGNCTYGDHCRKSIVVYKATCKKCDMFYVGNTQQKWKARMNQHYGETVTLV